MADTLPTLRARVEAAQALAAKATPGPWAPATYSRPWGKACGAVLAGETVLAAEIEPYRSKPGFPNSDLRLMAAAPDLVTLAADLLTLSESQAAELTAIRAALGNGADEAAWPPGLTVAEAVARLRVLVHEPGASMCLAVVAEHPTAVGTSRTLCPLPAGHAGLHANALAGEDEP